MSEVEDQSRYWSGYIKKDSCFLSRAAIAFEEELVLYQQRFCQGLEGTHALEIGCGDGEDAIGMVRQYGINSIVAIDFSDVRVNLARENVAAAGLTERIQIREMDAHRLDLPDNHFDIIFGNSVCLFMDRERFFPEAVRVLKPKGRLLFFRESLDGNPVLFLYRKCFPAAWKRGAEKFAMRLTVPEIDSLGQRFFGRVEHREFFLLFVIARRLIPWFGNRMLGWKLRRPITRGRWSTALDRMLLARFPRLRRFAWVSVISFSDPLASERASTEQQKTQV